MQFIQHQPSSLVCH